MQTVIEAFKSTVGNHGSKDAIAFKVESGEWQKWNWRQYWDHSMDVAKSLIALGIPEKSFTVILSFNRPEWMTTDLGSIAAGCVPAGIYTTCSSEQCLYIINHCKAKIAFVENKDQALKLLEVKNQFADLQKIIVFDACKVSDDLVMNFSDFIALGQKVGQDEVEKRVSTQKIGDLATLVYTSGTTANPKAVMLSHQNLTWTAKNLFEHHAVVDETDSFISYLPLSHIAEQVTSIHGPLSEGYCVYFAESIEKMPDNLKEVRPTLFFGVPRVWEKMHEKLTTALKDAPDKKKKIVSLCQKVALAHNIENNFLIKLFQLNKLVEKIITSKIKKAMGFDRTRYFLSAAAPLNKEVVKFFASLNIMIGEAYGMSESTGPTTVGLYPESFQLGSVGKVIENTQVEIAEDGEILIKGPHVFMGYLHDEKATKATLTKDGFLRSGDLGEKSEDGFIKVTGRAKNLIITAGGENISTEMLEGHFYTIEGVEHIVAVGDQKKYCSMLFTLNPETSIPKAQELGSNANSIAEVSSCNSYRSYVESEVNKINKGLARVQTIKKFEILSQRFEESTGELTPTLKVKRAVILKKYEPVIEGLYQ